jgi:hypothetical protein
MDRLGGVAASIAIAAIGWAAPALAQTATVRVGDAIKLAEEGAGWAGVTTAMLLPGAITIVSTAAF